MTDAHLEYLDRLDRGQKPIRSGLRGLVTSGLLEYAWLMKDGSVLTDTQLAGRFQGEFLPVRWHSEVFTEKGRKALAKYRRRAALEVSP